MISVLLPTTGRADMAERCVRELVDTTDGYDLEVIAAIDADQWTVDRLAALDRPPRVSLVLDVRDEYRGNVRAWNDALALASGDPVVFAADDLRWGSGWLTAALSSLDEHPGCLIGLNDGHWHGNQLSTHYLLPRSFIVEVLGGVVAWECYPHSFNDVETNERARLADRYAWCEGAHVYHEHWIFGDRPQDATDTRTLSEHASAQAMLADRRAAGFPNDYESVITE